MGTAVSIHLLTRLAQEGALSCRGVCGDIWNSENCIRRIETSSGIQE